MLNTAELIDRACRRVDCTTVDSRAAHRQLVVGETPVSLHWGNARDVEVLVDLGPVDSVHREVYLEAFLAANLAFYPEGRNMLALDPASRHAIFATRISIDEHTSDIDVAREIEAAAATGVAVRQEIAAEGLLPMPMDTGEARL
jgi:hypothetical protein